MKHWRLKKRSSQAPHCGLKRLGVLHFYRAIIIIIIIILIIDLYRVFRAQADWAFISPSELPAKELRHLPRKMPPRGTTY
jgi:hypothetical protein